MNLFEQFEANANCGACQRQYAKRRKYADFLWVCRSTKLIGPRDIPLPHPQPRVTVTKVLGFVSSMDGLDANGKLFGCRFKPRDGRRVDLRAGRK